MFLKHFLKTAFVKSENKFTQKLKRKESKNPIAKDKNENYKFNDSNNLSLFLTYICQQHIYTLILDFSSPAVQSRSRCSSFRGEKRGAPERMGDGQVLKIITQ